MSFEIAKGAIMKKRQLMIPTLNIDSSMYADEDDTLGFAEEKQENLDLHRQIPLPFTVG